ncbi:uncharacterized protein LOC141699898 [Apium graveolens]|uniref:uncharacterized protein LOC141699898 n=2 Tax=Apium graveolens TaxID=4045 RepID=UPI003D7B1B0A
MRVPREVDRSGKKEPVDSVSRSEEEGEEMVGEIGGGWSSWSGSNIRGGGGVKFLIVNMSGSSCKRVDQLRQSYHDRIIERLETGEITSERVLENVYDDGKNSDTRDEVNSFCVANNITVVNVDDIIQSRTRMRRDGQSVTNYHHYRVEVFCEVVDLISQELDNRFPETSIDLLISVACLDPRDTYSAFDVDKLVHLANLYPEYFSWTELLMIHSQLEMYIYDVKRDQEFSRIEDLGTLAKKMVATKLVYRLIELALLLPVATASIERVFSAMNIVKTDLRNRMGYEWMNDSLVVYIEKDVFVKIDRELILDRFQKMASRRIQLPPINSV